MSVVRSAQLCAVTTLSATNAKVYTVPAGKRTIVKWVNIRNNTAGSMSGTLYLKPGGAGGVDLVALPTGSLTFVDRAAWFVLNAGDEIWVSSTSTSTSVYLAGTELALP